LVLDCWKEKYSVAEELEEVEPEEERGDIVRIGVVD
jgi:hypothetical protein